MLPEKARAKLIANSTPLVVSVEAQKWTCGQYHTPPHYRRRRPSALPPDVLTQLRLCRRPGEAAPARTAGEDVAAIPQRFGLDAGALRRVDEDTARSE
jgi:hypothetical protein